MQKSKYFEAYLKPRQKISNFSINVEFAVLNISFYYTKRNFKAE